jgi:hypothetical protein
VEKGRRTAPLCLDGTAPRAQIVPGNAPALTEDEQHKIAAVIVEHLETHDWRIEQGPAREGHGPGLMGK